LVANAGGLCWQHINHAPLNSAVRFLDAAIVTGKGAPITVRSNARSTPPAGLPIAKVNPRQARPFAEAAGKLVKTDRDHACPARKAEQRAPHRDRLQNEEIDAAIEKLIFNDIQLARRFEILLSIPYVSKSTAFALLIEMPELWSLEGKQAASLAGLARPCKDNPAHGTATPSFAMAGLPFARPFICRARCLRHNKDSRALYQKLVDAGKPAKVAITAVMRKLVVLANALLQIAHGPKMPLAHNGCSKWAPVSNRVTAWRKYCSERFVHANTGVHNGKKNDCEEDCA
jgi:transposase